MEWLDLSDKVKAASSESVPKTTFPKAIDDFLYQRAAWEKVLNPTAFQPDKFARIVKGEWNLMVPHHLLPTLMNTEDPHAVSDAGELLDHLTLSVIDIVRTHQVAKLRDLPTLKLPPATDHSHLSRTSRQSVETLSIGMESWRKGWDLALSMSAGKIFDELNIKPITVPRVP